MRYILLILSITLQIQIFGQTKRKSEIEKLNERNYTVEEFKQTADSLQMSIDELCDYPIIFPIMMPIRISSGFGMRFHPIYKKKKFHSGIDIVKAKGSPVYATGNGMEIREGYNSGYGNYLEIEHAGGFRSFYAHLSKSIVSIGDIVYITQQIAFVGNSGLVTGSHLHYEVRKGECLLDPAVWCDYLWKLLINSYEYDF